MPRGFVELEDPFLSWLNLFLALALVALNGFFVAAEFALVRVRESRIQQLEQEGSARAGVVRDALRDLDDYLSVCQVGITVASLGLGWVGEPAVAHLIEPLLHAVGITSERAVTIISFVVGFALITYAHLVFGEQAPKYFSIQKAEGTALWISRPLRLFMVLFRPLVWLVNASTNFVLRPWGIKLGEEMEAHSEEELRIMISSSAASGELEPEERDYLNNVFDFGDRVAREIMVPRPDIEALSVDMPLPEMVDAAVFGRLHSLPCLRGGPRPRHRRRPREGPFARGAREPGRLRHQDDSPGLPRRPGEQAHFADLEGVPETQAADGDRDRRVGQRRGAHHHRGHHRGARRGDPGRVRRRGGQIEKIGDGVYAIDGRIPITEVNEYFDLDLPHEDFDTIGGYVLGVLGRPPEPGDTVEVDGVILQVKSVDGPRVSMLTLQRKEDARPRPSD